ncbi:MAG: preprotein translocase subunit YajC [Zetaproteobacteria bacterium]|nr:preprotein translocase subunit YajC [Zetaproteobacteria bacterium]
MLATTTMAHAEGAGGASEGFASLIPLVLIMVIFYFLLIRPQQKRAKEHSNMVSELKRGDKIITGGGIHGTISKVQDNTLTIEISDGVNITIQRDTITSLRV